MLLLERHVTDLATAATKNTAVASVTRRSLLQKLPLAAPQAEELQQVSAISRPCRFTTADMKTTQERTGHDTSGLLVITGHRV